MRNYAIPALANSVFVSGDYAYIAASGAGLYVVDVSEADNPYYLGSISGIGGAKDVHLSRIAILPPRSTAFTFLVVKLVWRLIRACMW